MTPGTTYVFVSNHQSIYDTPVLFASLPYQLRIIAKESLARFPVLGWHLKRGRHLFVDRKHPDRVGILNRWRALVSEGLSLIIFAEGTRSPDGHVARFKAGSFLLAIEAGLPVVPVAVIGTRAVMPKGRLRTEPANVTLIVHDPIPAPALERPTVRDAKAFADRAHAIVAATVEARQFSPRTDIIHSSCSSQSSSRPVGAACVLAAVCPSSCWTSRAGRCSSAAWTLS